MQNPLSLRLLLGLCLPALLQACSSSYSNADGDTADFFVKLSQGYRVETRFQLQVDAMWVPVDLEGFQDLGKSRWAKSIALLTGHIMQHKGIMEGRLFLLFRYQDGKIQREAKLCQAVETPVAGSAQVRSMSRPAGGLVQTTHRGETKSLGTAFRVLEDYIEKEGLKPTGWGSIHMIRGRQDETDPTRFLTRARLYIDQAPID